ncbi:cold-responsive protein kinase 1 [Nymphaea colorata]|nr:cold-responsive protein kinase 1 [Nymphaea colorata]
MMCFSFLFGRSHSSGIGQSNDEDEGSSGIQHVKIYQYKELKNATGDFSPLNKIGEGGFGSVYKGQLKGGPIVAIKVLSAESRQGAQEFLNEITAISNIVHENLVKLHGCCVEGDHRILVYGYAENNSLSHTLLDGHDSGLDFNWKVRSSICIGVARGLAFLHDEVKPYIVHRDIKASNILLDKNMNARISDFGLAKLIPSNASHVTTRVAGTIGYLAPEYAIRGQLTRKADIYSFGVLLLEIVSGRWNYNTSLPVGEQFLLERTWELYEEGRLLEIVDSRMGEFDPNEAVRFVKVALLCTQDMAKLRPSMITVVKMLMNKVSVDSREITKPGLISDLMELKVRPPTDASSPFSGSRTTQSRNDTSGQCPAEGSLFSSSNTINTTFTFTTNSTSF